MKNPAVPKLFLIFVSILVLAGCDKAPQKDPESLAVKVKNKPTYIEVGGPYAGIETHGGNPQLTRISLYYPVANSIDNSRDYWTRDTSRILNLGLRINDNAAQWLSTEPFVQSLTPTTAVFTHNTEGISLELTYRFFTRSPALLFQTSIVNTSDSVLTVEYLTDLNLVLRTSHTYRILERAWSSTDSSQANYFFHFDDLDAGPATVFIANRKTKPSGFDTRRSDIGQGGSQNHIWLTHSYGPGNSLIAKTEKQIPGLVQLYRKTLKPGENMIVEQVIGSCRAGEEQSVAKELATDDRFMENLDSPQSETDEIMVTGDPVLDHSIRWAQAIIKSNRHYLDGRFLPMPCPAQYNFYFTHDVLVTDLAMVRFDPQRVREDLLFIAEHANDNNIIPHAYYWKDSSYATEYAGSDNWNHFWFVIVSAEYLKHSGDAETLNRIFPLIEKSVAEALKNLHPDGMMWAERPDWWDIGHNYGPRAYMTILMARTLEAYNYLCVAVDRNLESCPGTETTIANLNIALNKNLWDDQTGYLMNRYANGRTDPHYYIGSLLAAHFGNINDDKIDRLLSSAQRNLLDDQIGIYNAAPMDFHLLYDSLSYTKDEAGKIGYYFNGGIWPHGNCWYALALMAGGQKDQAQVFIRKIMTVKGVMASPNGQPAMYEYRVSDKSNPAIYGKIDKPQFLWAGGWYLYSLYQLYFLRDNPWNINFDPFLSGKEVQGNLLVKGKKYRVRLKNDRDYGIYSGDQADYLPSLVIPADFNWEKELLVGTRSVSQPVLAATNAILLTAAFTPETSTLIVSVKSFAGHKNKISWITTKKPFRIEIENRTDILQYKVHEHGKGYLVEAEFVHSRPIEIVSLKTEEN